MFQQKNAFFDVLNGTFQETLPLLNITEKQTAWFDFDRYVFTQLNKENGNPHKALFFSFEISNTAMKFELTKTKEDIPYIECDIDSFVEYQFQDFFLSEPKRLKPIVNEVQGLIDTFLSEIENRNDLQVWNKIIKVPEKKNEYKLKNHPWK